MKASSHGPLISLLYERVDGGYLIGYLLFVIVLGEDEKVGHDNHQKKVNSKEG